MQIQAILFDLDGTLVDSNGFHVNAWDEAFREAGHVIPTDAIHGQIGKGADKLVPALVPGIADDAAARIGERHGDIFKTRYLDAVRPFPGAHDLLAKIHGSGRRIVIASSAARDELDHYVALLDAADLITAGTSIDDVSESKPAPDIFATALGKLIDVPPEWALAVGDAPYDIEAAARSGIATVAVRSGGFGDRVLADAIAIYDDVAVLLAGFEASPLAR